MAIAFVGPGFEHCERTLSERDPVARLRTVDIRDVVALKANMSSDFSANYHPEHVYLDANATSVANRFPILHDIDSGQTEGGSEN